MKRGLRSVLMLVIAVVAGLIFASAVLSIAFNENPQGEFFDTATGSIHLGNVLPLFFTSFLESALVVCLVEVGLYLLASMFKR